MVEDLCDCTGFVQWYVDGHVKVCRCGHPQREHITPKGSCLGDVVRL